jgi:hypothetical protein
MIVNIPCSLYLSQFTSPLDIRTNRKLTVSCAAILFPCRMRAKRLYSVLVRYFGSIEAIESILQIASKSSRSKPGFANISGTLLISMELSTNCVRDSLLLMSSQHVSDSCENSSLSTRCRILCLFLADTPDLDKTKLMISVFPVLYLNVLFVDLEKSLRLLVLLLVMLDIHCFDSYLDRISPRTLSDVLGSNQKPSKSHYRCHNFDLGSVHKFPMHHTAISNRQLRFRCFIEFEQSLTLFFKIRHRRHGDLSFSVTRARLLR